MVEALQDDECDFLLSFAVHAGLCGDGVFGCGDEGLGVIRTRADCDESISAQGTGVDLAEDFG
jgi:hypothetical protein